MISFVRYRKDVKQRQMLVVHSKHGRTIQKAWILSQDWKLSKNPMKAQETSLKKLIASVQFFNKFKITDITMKFLFLPYSRDILLTILAIKARLIKILPVFQREFSSIVSLNIVLG